MIISSYVLDTNKVYVLFSILLFFLYFLFINNKWLMRNTILSFSLDTQNVKILKALKNLMFYYTRNTQEKFNNSKCQKEGIFVLRGYEYFFKQEKYYLQVMANITYFKHKI